MAVTVTQLAAALRLGDGTSAPAEPVNGMLTRYLAVATALIDNYTEDAPAEISDQATIQIAGYLFDQPEYTRGDSAMTAWRYSGAASLLASWTTRKTGITE